MCLGAVGSLHHVLQADGQAQGGDHQRDDAVAYQRIDHQELEADAEQQHGSQAGEHEGEPQGRADREQEQHRERGQHHELALGEVDGSGGLP